MSETDPRAWIGRTREGDDTVDAWRVAAFNAALDREASLPADGTPLPPCWQWLLFPPLYRASASGGDGHERLGAFLPALPAGHRRMWAGSRMTIERPLQVGERVHCRSTVAEVVPKTGRSGPLVFVTVSHEIEGERGGRIDEAQDIVYRAPAPGGGADTAGSDDMPEPAWRATWRPDPVLLFRYSALTYNSHRIHYDRSYCTGVEGYPGLVVHGPLMATLMLDLAVQQRGTPVRRFEYRSRAPVFDDMAFTTAGVPEGDGARLWVTRPDGALALTGRME
ncbi:MaoC family dehydratase N-terminal domain-containing protein [Arhodomonas aquaeolei]|uniref:FAS1-like dehydratase domain-containing protein n=1 Tax=Arhodomonas aquaeolei TaxID=2369 RepID=UPI002168374E|nr:MaoC family dehydratase N-terminal domain-containing protein [Arhodomonas aquaeolei]MCS4504780.1 MaoC family dehydratase N-terminal domain-containing protein [Arhodomonas aquaeolei]